MQALPDIAQLYANIVEYVRATPADQLFFEQVIPPGLFVIMFGMGLTLTLADLKRIVVYPRAVTIGLVGQLLCLPILAFTIAAIFQPAPFIAVGLILLAACPGGVTSNAYVFAARGDVALSVTLTTIASFITVFTIPMLTYFALSLYFEQGQVLALEFWPTVEKLARLTILPVGLGMLSRVLWPAWATRSSEVFRRVALAFLIAIIIVAVIGGFEKIMQNIAAAGLMALTLNVSAVALGYALARGFKLSKIQSVTIVFEIGVQNLSLAALVAFSILKRPELFIFTLVYSLIMKISALTLLAFAGRILDPERRVTKTAPAAY